MRIVKRLGLLLDLLLLATSLAGGGPIAAQIRTLTLVVVCVLGALAMFSAIVLIIAVVQQRQEPYPM